MEDQKKSLIRSLESDEKEEKNKAKKVSFFYFFSYLGLAIFLGILTGFLLTKIPFKIGPKEKKEIKKEEKAAGVVDKKIFKDKAEGILKEGGIDGEGNFHLERPGGPSQNVYLTSSTVDLSSYVGKKVRVYGQTFAGQKAGWLMDVGYIEVLEEK